MPISKYFGGHGAEVMKSMKKGKSDKAAKREFYATANARNQGPKGTAKQKKHLAQGYRNKSY
jgi:hypothetical protein